jgi:cobalt-zinc-cadmium efflux system membrane fusion protein
VKRLMLVVGMVLWLAGCGQAPPPPAAAPKKDAKGDAKGVAREVELGAAAMKEANVRVVDVAEQSVPLTIRANGRLTSNENATWRVGAITDGRIIEAAAKVGDQVEKGQVMARMHSHDIHESRALYRRAVAELNRLQSNLEYARRQRDRVKRLYEMKAASQEQVDASENELKNVQTAAGSAQIEVNRTRMHLVEFLGIPAEGSEEKSHDAGPETHVEDLIPVRAPASGVVLTRLITPGAVVQASGDLYVICDLSTIWVMAAVQEEYLSKVRVGMEARVTVQAYPEHAFVGKVTKIDEKLDRETRTVQARVEVDNRRGLLKPEMYAGVELKSGGSEAGLFVSQVAVQDLNGQATVFVEKDAGRFEARAVEVGRTMEGMVQILRGLKAGERVVAGGSFILKSQLLKATLSGE